MGDNEAEAPGAAPKMCYLDNSATTLMAEATLTTMLRWCNRGSPAAGYASAKEARGMIGAFRREIAVQCGFDLEGPDAYEVVFSSGASESNCHILTSAVRAYAAKTGRQPHVVTSAAEHESVLGCCRRLAAEKQCQLTVLPVGQAGSGLGAVAPDDLAAALRPNTCLVSILAASHETGILNNLRELSAVARRARVPFHSDAAQLFGKSALRPRALGLDAFSASFHKLRGPPGVGLLIVRRCLVAGYGLCPLVCGALNGGLRGGAENVPGLAASFAAYREAVKDRAAKTARVAQLRARIKAALAARLPCFALGEHPADRPPSIDGGITPAPPPRHPGSPEARRALLAADEMRGAPVVFWVAPADERLVLPSILVFAVRRPGLCAEAVRAALEKRGVIVGIGLGAPRRDVRRPERAYALEMPSALRENVFRVSLGDDSTAADADLFTRNFLEVILSTECFAADLDEDLRSHG